jgi:hypothetical protein
MTLRSFSSAMQTRSTPYSRRGTSIRDESIAQQQARRQRELEECMKRNKELTKSMRS